MKKRLGLLLIVILSIGMLVGCGDSKDEVVDPPVKKEDVNKGNETKSKLDEFKSELKLAGFEIGDNETVAFELIGATNGYKFKVDGEIIEIYEYDEMKLTDEGKKMFEEAKRGSINMSGFNIPVKTNKNIVIVREDEHSKGDRILEIFNKL